MKFGIYLGRANPSIWVDLTLAAEAAGFESVWIPEHLILPTAMAGSPVTGHDESPIPPSTPTFDALGYLSFLAGRTSTIKLGTWVYVLALRHPFVAARAVQTADLVSNGRLLLGVGAGWLREEWQAAGIDFDSRGKRLDEALDICRRLWTEDRVLYDGDFYSFDEVMFEPKPVQRPHPPVLIGGESPAALRRAATADGWMGMNHTPETARPLIEALTDQRRALGGPPTPFDVTVGASPRNQDDLDAWTELGVDRLIVSPWQSTKDAIESTTSFAERLGLQP